MDNKNIIVIAVVIIAVIIVGALFITGFFNNQSNSETTAFSTAFMSGSFAGDVSQVNTSNQSFLASYEDKKHDITYNLTTMDNTTALMEIYEFQGVSHPEERSFNGQDWNIYFGEAVPTVNGNTSNNTNESMGIIICQAQLENQGYVIYVIFGEKSDVNFTLNTYGESYTDYIEPLLNSISLKKSDDVPSINEEFGLSKEEFDQQIELIHQVNAGNYSALEG